MINDGKNNVPEKTIVLFKTSHELEIEDERVFSLISKAPKRRDWFLPYFYKCLPLTIGNQYGFVISCEYGFSFSWDGTLGTDAITFNFDGAPEDSEKYFPRVESHFGNGVITISLPFTLRTPPKVNLMTINPPNVILPNVTVMTGVVEADNARTGFTFNLKIQQPKTQVYVPAGYPLAAIIPIPRFYVDEYQLVFAKDVFSEDLIKEEIEAYIVSSRKRDERKKTSSPYDNDYTLGRDTYGNKFIDHQSSLAKERKRHE